MSLWVVIALGWLGASVFMGLGYVIGGTFAVGAYEDEVREFNPVTRCKHCGRMQTFREGVSPQAVPRDAA